VRLPPRLHVRSAPHAATRKRGDLERISETLVDLHEEIRDVVFLPLMRFVNWSPRVVGDHEQVGSLAIFVGHAQETLGWIESMLKKIEATAWRDLATESEPLYDEHGYAA
jgi:hypothetical protein